MRLTSQPTKKTDTVYENEMRLTSQPTKKTDTVYEDEMHKLNTELQISLLKWKITSIEKKTKFEF